MPRLLVLVRHGQSEWNRKNLFTGWKDPDLTEKGVEEAHAAGRLLKARGMQFDRAFTSNLIRAQRTLSLILEELGQKDLLTISDDALNEREWQALAPSMIATALFQPAMVWCLPDAPDAIRDDERRRLMTIAHWLLTHSDCVRA